LAGLGVSGDVGGLGVCRVVHVLSGFQAQGAMMEIFVITPEVNDLVRQVEVSVHQKTRGIPHVVYYTDVPARGVVNRNMALDMTEGEFAVSLDNDLLILDDNWLELMLETMRRDSRIAMVGPKVILPDGTIHSCGTTPDFRPQCFGRKCEGQECVREVVALTSTAFLYRREAFREVRWDRGFTGSGAFSDTDICLRLRKRGWKMFCDGRVKILHLKPQTNGKWYEWNHAYFHLKHPSTILNQRIGA
jgi:GT2 family glycosyltransferase